jgi:hypothetical protein
VPALLSAMPEGAPNNDPAVDSHATACPESSADDASGDRGGSASSSPAGSENSAASPCGSKPAEAIVPKNDPKNVPQNDPKKDPDEVPKKEVRPESDVAPAKIPIPVEIQPNRASSIGLPDGDKRACRALAGDGPLF